MQINYLIRKANRDDVAAINDIVNESIRTSCSNWAWTERSYEEALKWFDEHDCERYCIFVAESESMVVGFGSLSSFRSKQGYWPVAENSIYIHKDFRGKGIGPVLLEKLIESAENTGLWAISAWIDSENKTSIKMHERYGFYITGEMRNVGEKMGKRRSVTIMQKDFKDEK